MPSSALSSCASCEAVNIGGGLPPQDEREFKKSTALPITIECGLNDTKPVALPLAHSNGQLNCFERSAGSTQKTVNATALGKLPYDVILVNDRIGCPCQKCAQRFVNTVVRDAQFAPIVAHECLPNMAVNDRHPMSNQIGRAADVATFPQCEN